MSIVALTPWGNSIGLRIPSNVIKSAGAYVGERFEISVKQHGSFVLTPLKDPQANWAEAFNAAADTKAAHMLLKETPTDFDQDE